MSVKKQPTPKKSSLKDVKKVAAKKAVKSVVSKSATKTVQKKTKASLKVVKKPVGQKKVKVNSVKKTSVKTPRRIAGTKRAYKKAVLKEKAELKKDEISEVLVPSNMSKRSVSKASALRSLFEGSGRVSVIRISYIAGLCYILVGTALSLSSSDAGFAADGSLMVGQVVQTTQSTSQTGSADPYLIGPTSFNFLSTVPSVIDQNFAVNFQATNIDGVKVWVESTSSPFSKLLAVQNTVSDKYRTDIKFDELDYGSYRIKVAIKPLDNSTERYFTTGVFRKVQVNAASSAVAGTSTGINPVASTGLVPSDGTLPLIQVVDLSDPVDTKPDTVPAPILDDRKPFSIFSPLESSVLSGSADITFSASDNITFTELYARPVNSLEFRFISLGDKISDKWTFSFDSRNLPNGKYEFYVKSKIDAKSAVSDTVMFYVSNSSVIAPVDNPGLEKDPVDRPLIEIINQVDETVAPTFSVNEDVVLETDRLFSENEADINDLLKRYSVAVQSGDAILIETAKNALDKKRDSITIQALQDERVGGLADNIDQEIKERLDSFVEKVQKFEQIRVKKSGGTSAKDTDSDGVSDFDEINLYGTDPEIADTDNDGVADGVEIIKGYDPTDAKSEAVVKFESPKTSIAIINDDVIKVVAVEPLVEKAGALVKVKTEIRGSGLPNSFVTLYIFSSPTIVTVKTDADGSFVYTFDKELEDGAHDVYVAITDNAGEIVAKTSPFSFIKEAQAYTPIDASKNEIVSNETVVESASNDYGRVVGIGILALGLILIMLGMSLKGKKEDDGESDNDQTSTHIDAT